MRFPDKEALLQTLQSQAQYMESLAETLTNIFQIIKAKQLSCYPLLRDYIEVMRRSDPWSTPTLQKYPHIWSEVEKQKEKVGTISQIIYEFDHNYSIREPLQELKAIEEEGLTSNCINTQELYKTILSEIIQIRNGLKLDHYFSVNQIHSKFSLLATSRSRNRPQDLFFEDIIH
jgi:gluconate kinase